MLVYENEKFERFHIGFILFSFPFPPFELLNIFSTSVFIYIQHQFHPRTLFLSLPLHRRHPSWQCVPLPFLHTASLVMVTPRARSTISLLYPQKPPTLPSHNSTTPSPVPAWHLGLPDTTKKISASWQIQWLGLIDVRSILTALVIAIVTLMVEANWLLFMLHTQKV
jgi:hypothetical protein